ncbi:MAG: redoxin domain-containing protein [Candidatus Eisenbacteria bacterium]|nr:redoxin domain-containing protein [Candidatus Eisenbacteria bacterium]
MTPRWIPMTVLLLTVGVTSATAGGWNSPPSNPLAQSPLPLVPLGTSAEYAVLDVGSSAPDFAYQAIGGGWNRLHDLRQQGPVLLVVAAGEEQLASLQREREELLRMGVVPVAVVDRRASACRRHIARLGLTYPVIPDPTRIIAAQFNALDPSSRAAAPAWFVLDERGRVRDLNRHQWPSREWADIASSALGLPRSSEPRPASTR